MERLTHKARYEAGYKLNKGVLAWQAADALGAYENTGLTPAEILDGKFIKVVNEDGVHPHCPICNGGEYMLNEDGNRNDYCGSCGCHLDWSDVDDEVRNDE